MKVDMMSLFTKLSKHFWEGYVKFGCDWNNGYAYNLIVDVHILFLQKKFSLLIPPEEVEKCNINAEDFILNAIDNKAKEVLSRQDYDKLIAEDHKRFREYEKNIEQQMKNKKGSE